MKKNFVVAFALLVGILVSCDKDFNTIGSDIVGNGNYDFKKELVESIKIYSKPTGSVQSNNLPVNSLGIYNDDYFGEQRASFVTQLELAAYTSSDLGVDIEVQSVDSVYLYVPYFSTQTVTATGIEANTYELDSIYGDASSTFDLKIYENEYFLSDFDTSDPTEEQAYYSGATDRALIESNLGNQLNTATNINQNTQFYFSAAEHIIYETDGNGGYVDSSGDPIMDLEDRVVKERYEPGMWIDLDESFRTKILSATETDLMNSNNFKEFFKGLYFKVSSNGNDGAMAQLDFSSAYVVVQYHAKDDVDSDLEKKSIKFTLTGNNVNFFENDNPIAEFGDETLGSEEVVLKGQDGSAAFIDLFKINSPLDDVDGNNVHDDLDEIMNKDVLINDVIMTLRVKNSSQQENAARLYLYDAGNNLELIDYTYDTTTLTDTKLNKYLFGGILSETSTDSGVFEYTFRLTSYFKYLIDSEDVDLSNIKLGLVVTENINNSSLVSVEDELSNDYFKEDKIPVGTVMNPLGTVLYGNLTDQTFFDENGVEQSFKIKLEIYYTDPN